MNNKKVKEKTIRFKDYPEFRPNLTPRKILLLGPILRGIPLF